MIPERIVLFDGACNLCSRSVQFIIRNDPAEFFKFCSLQSQAAADLLTARNCTRPDFDSVVLLEQGVFYTLSTAALRIAGKLQAPWKFLALLLVVPRPIRDLIYRTIAANRYRFFGMSRTCPIPTAVTKARFLEFGMPTEAVAPDQLPNPVQ